MAQECCWKTHVSGSDRGLIWGTFGCCLSLCRENCFLTVSVHQQEKKLCIHDICVRVIQNLSQSVLSVWYIGDMGAFDESLADVLGLFI